MSMSSNVFNYLFQQHASMFMLCLYCMCLVAMETLVVMASTDGSSLQGNHSSSVTTGQPMDDIHGAWTNCPERCTCQDKGRHLRCDHRNFTSVPVLLTLQVELLNLSANHITVLTNHSFYALDSMWRLHLDQNYISSIHPEAFHELTRLSFLFLQYNLLRMIPPHVFSHLYNLSTLDLSHNALEAIPQNLFLNTTSLRQLNLSGNKFSGIPESAFVHAMQLQVLDLSKNPITNIHVNTFSALSNLEKLNLQHTRLKKLHQGIFLGLDNLKVLNLSHSGLVDFNVTAVQLYMPRIEILDLSGIYLLCDCRLQSLTKWLTNHSSSPQAYSPVCSKPKAIQGKLVVDLSIATLTCPVQQLLNATTTTLQLVPWGQDVTDAQEEPLPYDPMLGWYTAATLGGMLVVFLLCLGMDKVKRHCIKIENSRRRHYKEVFYRHNIAAPEDEGYRGAMPLREQPRRTTTIVLPELQVDSEPLVPSGESDYVYLTPSKPASAPMLGCNECPKVAPQKVLLKPHTGNGSPPKVLQAGDVKFQILEINPECPLHSPKMKGRGPGTAGTEETIC